MSPSAVPQKPRVFALDPLHPDVRALADRLFDLTVIGEPGFKSWREDADGLMVRSNTITAEDVELFSPNLKFIAKHGVGVDRINVAALKKKGVKLMNTPGVNASAVAELSLALALNVARHIGYIDRTIRSGTTLTKAEAGVHGIQLTGKTLGLIGGGNIGYQLGKMFYGAFDAHIIVFDPFLSPAMTQKWADLIPSNHFTRVDNLDSLLQQSDVVSLHVPLLDSTRDLISEPQFKLMKKEAILLNAARGGIVNEAALLKALNEKWILGAGLDAWSIEPPSTADFAELIAHDRVITTPHIGAASLDVIRMTGFSVVEHLADALSGKEIRDVVV